MAASFRLTAVFHPLHDTGGVDEDGRGPDADAVGDRDSSLRMKTVVADDRLAAATRRASSGASPSLMARTIGPPGVGSLPPRLAPPRGSASKRCSRTRARPRGPPACAACAGGRGRARTGSPRGRLPIRSPDPAGAGSPARAPEVLPGRRRTGAARRAVLRVATRRSPSDDRSGVSGRFRGLHAERGFPERPDVLQVDNTLPCSACGSTIPEDHRQHGGGRPLGDDLRALPA